MLTSVPGDDMRVILAELLAAFTVYRAYVVPGQPPPPASAARVSAAAAQARRRLPGRLHAAADLIAALLLGRGVKAGLRQVRDEFIVRFQQTCAAVQAKGVEDTAALPLHQADICQRGRRGPGASRRWTPRISTQWPAHSATTGPRL